MKSNGVRVLISLGNLAKSGNQNSDRGKPGKVGESFLVGEFSHSHSVCSFIADIYAKVFHWSVEICWERCKRSGKFSNFDLENLERSRKCFWKIS